MKKRLRDIIHMLPGWKESRYARYSWIILFVIGFFALFGPWIANEKPFYCKLDGKSYYPVFTSTSEANLSSRHPEHAPVDWHKTKFDAVVRTLIPYSHYTVDFSPGALLSPFDTQSTGLSQRHWLGTDALGHDVLAAMIRGCRISLLIGLVSMLVAFLIGVPLASIAAYWGNRGARMSWVQFTCFIIGVLLVLFIFLLPIALASRWIAVICLIIFLFWIIWWMRDRFRNTISIPYDHLISGMVNIVDGFPAMFLIIVLVVLLPFKGWLVIMLIIGLLHWPVMSRYVRAEVYKMRESNYIKAVQVINLPSYLILKKHILPFALRPVMVSFIFGVASAILAESTLSFLGIGLPLEQMNWGRLLAQSRSHFDAWWLMLFPGGAIFLTLISLYTIGNAWQRKINA